MQGIVSGFDKTMNQQIESIWQAIETQFGLENAVLPKIPHFSYHVAVDYDLPAIKAVMDDIAKSTAAFIIRSSGIGVFTGEYPVVYLPIAMTVELSRLHERIWTSALSHSQQAQSYYAPNLWMPHITLAQGKFDSQLLGKMVGLLNRDRYQWQIEVDNLTLLYQEEKEKAHQIYHQVNFSKSED